MTQDTNPFLQWTRETDTPASGALTVVLLSGITTELSPCGPPDLSYLWPFPERDIQLYRPCYCCLSRLCSGGNLLHCVADAEQTQQRLQWIRESFLCRISVLSAFLLSLPMVSISVCVFPMTPAKWAEKNHSTSQGWNFQAGTKDRMHR